MRIGIVTFFGPYGGALQCFALQHVLRSMGHDVSVINRKWGTFNHEAVKSGLSKTKQSIRSVILKDPFADFYRQNYSFSIPVTSNEVLQELGTKKNFDIIIAGSDQPWNPDCIKTMGYYFYLDWVSPEVRKYAYAVSFGKDFFNASEAEVQDIKKLLKTYSAISVREKSGVEICKKMFDIDVQECLDPTLLLNASDYESLIADKKESHKYICKFFLDLDPNKDTFVAKIAEKEQIAVIDNNPVIPSNRLAKLFFRQRSISEWLRNIRDAQYVITDSFHGTVFSVLFHKRFISINNKKRGSTRFESFLSKINLMNRLYDLEVLDINSAYEVLKRNINYSEVDYIINDMRLTSVSFLEAIR